jgi:phenylacetate-CoA ligase
MIGGIYRTIVYPAYETLWKRRKTMQYWRELERTQWLSSQELRDLQIQSLRRLLSRTFADSPYYRDEWEKRGLHPASLESLADFQHWPVIDRDVIRKHRFDMRSTAPGLRLYSKATGGSSGVPLHLDFDWDAHDRRMAAWNRGYAWAGAAPGTKQLYIWGIALGDIPRWKRWKDYAYMRMLYRRRVLNTFDLRDETIPAFFQSHNQYRPEVIVAYTNPLYQLSRSFEERGWKPYSPKSIIVGAEKLHDFQRQTIERVFQAPVFETYGSREFTMIAGECDRHDGMHLTSENLLVEVLNDDGTPTPAGEEGNIVITDLTNYGMPFIRYVNGDRAIAGFDQCTCGRGLPLLKKVVGRQLDIIRTPDGRYVPGEFFPHLLKDFSPIQRFQVVQDFADQLDLKIVASQEWSPEMEASLRAIIEATTGEKMKLVIHRVEEIPLTHSGKLQVVINRHGNGIQVGNASSSLSVSESR